MMAWRGLYNRWGEGLPIGLALLSVVVPLAAWWFFFFPDDLAPQFSVRMGKSGILEETREVDLLVENADPRILSGWTRPLPGVGRAPRDGGELTFYCFHADPGLILSLHRNPTPGGEEAQPLEFGLLLNDSSLGVFKIDPASREILIPLPTDHLMPVENRLAFKILPKETNTLPARLPWFTSIGFHTSSGEIPQIDQNNGDQPGDNRIPSGACLHLPAHVPPGAILTWKTTWSSGMEDGNGSPLTLFIREPRGEIQALTPEVRQENDHLHYSVNLAGFSNRLVDLFFVNSHLEGKGRNPEVHLAELRLLAPQAVPHEDLNVILIVVDTLRADHLGCYGARGVSTPAMDRFAAEGIVFKQAYSHIPITGPSHGTLFTGRFPSEIGVLNNGQPLPGRELCLAETMLYSGRSTYGFISMEVLRRSLNFNQGFEAYRGEIPAPWMLSAGEVNSRVFEDLLKDPREPFFAFIHYSDPHEPYLEHGESSCQVEVRDGSHTLAAVNISQNNVVSFKMTLKPGMNRLRFSGDREFYSRGVIADPKPAGFRQDPGTGWTNGPRGVLSTKDGEMSLVSGGDQPVEVSITCLFSEVLTTEEIQRNYAREVEYVDQEIGKLIQALDDKGLLDRTLLILTADHGESLGEHDHVGHVDQLYDPLIHVPLIFHCPWETGKGTCIEGLAALSDVAPTLWDLLQIEVPSQPRGISLLKEIRGGTGESHRAILLGTFAPEALWNMTGVRTATRKYIRTIKTGREEVYNLKNDTGEITNIADREILTTQQMNDLLAPWTHASMPVQASSENGEVMLDESTRQMLKGLGYFR